MKDKDEVLRRVLVHIQQYAEHPPEVVTWTEVDHYHQLLNQLESIGYDASDFRIRSAMYSTESSESYFNPNAVSFSGEPEMDPNHFARFVRALYSYFEISEKPVYFTGPTSAAQHPGG